MTGKLKFSKNYFKSQCLIKSKNKISSFKFTCHLKWIIILFIFYLNKHQFNHITL